MMDTEGVSLHRHAGGARLHFLYERTKDLSVYIIQLLSLSRLKRILCHFPEFLIGFQLFPDFVESSEVREETLIEFHFHGIARDPKVFEFSAHKTEMRLLFLENVVGRDSRHKAVRSHNIKKVQALQSCRDRRWSEAWLQLALQ